ncbi:MAG: hypothetical protein O7F73_19560 [Gammaproteobacteria bacterium]|nr:hypothetical protein [Gammaproteobacteria bacterium]
MNGEIAFQAMTSRVKDIERDDEGFEWAPSLFRIPGRCPVHFRQR